MPKVKVRVRAKVRDRVKVRVRVRVKVRVMVRVKVTVRVGGTVRDGAGRGVPSSVSTSFGHEQSLLSPCPRLPYEPAPHVSTCRGAGIELRESRTRETGLSREGW